MKRISLSAKFMLLKMLQYAVMTCFSSFALAYLKSARALTDSQASLMLMLNTLGAFAGQFIAGRLCDIFRTHKKIFIAELALIVPTALTLYHLENIPAICATYFFYGLIQVPLSVMTDTWFMDSFPGNPGGYGKMQAAGAMTYAAMSIVYGRMLDIFGYGIMPWCLTTLVLLAALLSATLPDAQPVSGGKKRADSAGIRAFSAPLVIFIITLMLTCFSSYTYSLLPVLMNNVNASNIVLGLAMSLAGITQIPFMLIAGRINRIPARLRSAGAAAIYFTMALLFTFARSPWPLVVGAAISGAAWGLQLPAYRTLVAELAPPQVRNTAQGVADASMSLAGAMSAGFVSLSSGIIGMKYSLMTMSVMALISVCILVIENRRRA